MFIEKSFTLIQYRKVPFSDNVACKFSEFGNGLPWIIKKCGTVQKRMNEISKKTVKNGTTKNVIVVALP